MVLHLKKTSDDSESVNHLEDKIYSESNDEILKYLR
jgi:hypothetical protein